VRYSFRWMEDRPPERIGGYRIERTLGRGGLGVVYVGVHEGTGRRVAIKQLLAAASADPNVVRLFEREYHTLAQLQHPRIIEVYEYGVDRTGCYYTMELLDGQDLRELAPLGIREACSHLRDVASSLGLLHVRRLIHRDVSPRNVRLTSEGRAKLIDFGALTTFGTPMEVVGTPACAAPEMVRGEPLDHRTDLYSLGALGYYALTGQYPYRARIFGELPDVWRAPITPPSALRADIPPALEELILALLRHDPMSRPSSAAEVIERLTAIADLPREGEAQVADAYLQSPVLVGREEPLRRLCDALDNARRGQGSYLVIDGQAGTGKTRMLTAFSVEAQLEGATAVGADAELCEGPYGMARELVGSLLLRLPSNARGAVDAVLPVLVGAFADLARRLPDIEPSPPPDDPAEQRARIQHALAHCFVAASEQAPVVLLVDNLHQADEESLALLTGLAYEAREKRLLIVATRTPEAKPAAPAALRGVAAVAETVELHDLAPADVTALVHGIFGEIAGADRLAAYLHRVTQGNPLQCMELGQHLVRQGVVRYVDGSWVLPNDLAAEALPVGIEDARRAKLARLSDDARRAAEALSISRRGMSIETCLSLTGVGDSQALFTLLDELVAAGVLLSRGGHYHFAQPATRQALEATLGPERRRTLHARAAAALLESSEQTWERRMDAGWHLIHAGERSEGADVLVDASMYFARNGFGLAMSVDALEAALAIYDEERRSDREIADIFYALTQAALYVDHRLARRYGPRAIALMRRTSGLGTADRLARYLWPKLALALGVAWAFVRYAVWRDPRKHRTNACTVQFPEFIAAMAGMPAYVAGAAAIVGDAAVLDQVERSIVLLQHMNPRRSPWLAYSVCMHVILSGRGRHAECMAWCKRELELLADERNYGDIPPGARAQLLGGSLITIALAEAWATSPHTYDWAERLESTGVQMMGVYAHTARFHYHMLRGEWAQAAKPMAQLEMHAARGGTTWQAELFLDSNLIEATHMLGDVAALRRMRERSARVAQDAPSLEPAAEMARGAHLCLRGQPEEGVAIARRVLERLPGTMAGLWWSAQALLVRALNQAGRHAEAADASRQAFAATGPEDRPYGAAPFDVHLQLVRAEMELGRFEVARAEIEHLLTERTPRENPLEMGLLCRARAELALRENDPDTFLAFAREMERWVRPTQNPALIAQWERLCDRGEAEGIALRRSESADIAAVDGTLEEAIALLHTGSPSSRFEQTLQLILKHTGASRGHLWVVEGTDIRRVAASNGDPPPELESRVRDMIRRLTDAEAERTQAQTLHNEDGTVELSRYSYSEALSSHMPVVLSAREGDRLLVVGIAAISIEGGRITLPPMHLVTAITRTLAQAEGLGWTRDLVSG
jgi:hypothetical protein